MAMIYQSKTTAPELNEPICLVSYVIANTRVGGGPGERTGFWAAYWEALAFNEKSHYANHRIAIVKPLIEELLLRNPGLDDAPFYYREGRLQKSNGNEVVGAL